MADNVAVTAGSGTNIATDDVGGVHYQRVKLVDGTLDSSAAIGGDATNGLDVDVTRVIPGTSATHLGKAEDAAHVSGDTGVMMLAVRRDTAAHGVSADGDYATLNVDDTGRLHVVLGGTGGSSPVKMEDSASGGSDAGMVILGVRLDSPSAQTDSSGDYTKFTTDSSGRQLVQLHGTGTTNNPVKAEDSAHASGEAGMLIFAVRRNSVTSGVDTDGDLATFNVDTNGRLYVNALLAANSGVDVGDVDVLSVVPGTSATHLGKAEDAAHSSGDTGVAVFGVRRDTPVNGAGTDGDYATLNLDANGQLYAVAGAPDIAISATPTLDTSAYAAGDSYWTTAVELAAASRFSGGVTILQSVTVVDKDDQKPAFDLFFFDRTVTFGTANGAPSISDTDAGYYQGHVSIAAADYKDLGGVSVACAKGIGLAMKPNATSLFIAAMVSTTPTHTASGLVFQFTFLRS